MCGSFSLLDPAVEVPTFDVGITTTTTQRNSFDETVTLLTAELGNNDIDETTLSLPTANYSAASTLRATTPTTALIATENISDLDSSTTDESTTTLTPFWPEDNYETEGIPDNSIETNAQGEDEENKGEFYSLELYPDPYCKMVLKMPKACLEWSILELWAHDGRYDERTGTDTIKLISVY